MICAAVHHQGSINIYSRVSACYKGWQQGIIGEQLGWQVHLKIDWWTGSAMVASVKNDSR